MTALPPVPVPFLFNAWVLSWHDADTLLAKVDRGLRDYSTWNVRALGYAARELSEPGGREALQWLTGHLAIGSAVVLATVKPDKYGGRLLARVFHQAAPGVTVDLASTMIAEGWGAPWNGRGPQPKPPWPRPQEL